jgi:hypothetical protein
MNRSIAPCDPPKVLRAAIDRGIAARASFLEIYAEDCENPEMQPILAAAHQLLESRAAGLRSYVLNPTSQNEPFIGGSH